MTEPHPLASLPLEARLERVAEDVRSRTDEFADVDPFELAELLGITDTDYPGWGRSTYAVKESLEDFVRSNGMSELEHYLPDDISDERQEALSAEFSRRDGCDEPELDFLTADERTALEERIWQDQLNSNIDNGMNYLGHLVLRTPTGDELDFEAELEDDGACLRLRTPYDARDGRFAIQRDDIVVA